MLEQLTTSAPSQHLTIIHIWRPVVRNERAGEVALAGSLDRTVLVAKPRRPTPIWRVYASPPLGPIIVHQRYIPFWSMSLGHPGWDGRWKRECSYFNGGNGTWTRVVLRNIAARPGWDKRTGMKGNIRRTWPFDLLTARVHVYLSLFFYLLNFHFRDKILSEKRVLYRRYHGGLPDPREFLRGKFANGRLESCSRRSRSSCVTGRSGKKRNDRGRKHSISGTHCESFSWNLRFAQNLEKHLRVKRVFHDSV